MHKVFSFKGIVKNTDNMLANEGECLEIINMRLKDGSLVPVGRPAEIARLDYAYSRIYRHNVSGCYLCLTDEESPHLHIYDGEWALQKDSDGNVLFPSLCGVRGVEFLGYIVCCMTDCGIFYMLYNDGHYIWLGEKPPMPSLDISISSKLSHTVTENEYYTSGNEGIESTWYYNAKGFFDEAISAHNRNGYYIDRALFKFALRLYDGSYISISPAMYVSDDNEVNGIRRDGGNLKYEASGSSMPSKYAVMVLGFKPKFVFTDINLDNWKNIVVGIDLFTTGSIMGKKVESVRRGASSVGGDREVAEYDVYMEKSLEELSGDILSAAHYYRIAEYDIDGRLVDSLDNVSQLNLVLQPSLVNDECRYASLAPSCTYVFNNRLHIAALKSWFMKGYDPLFLKNASAAKAVVETIVIRTRIKTIQGISEVVREYRNVELPYGSGGYELSPLLSYPDARAFEMCITLYDGSKYVSRTFALTPHRYLDQAQYLHYDILGFSVSYKAELSNGNTVAPLRDADVVGMFSSVAGKHEVVYSKSRRTWLHEGTPFPTGEYASLRLVRSTGDLEDGDRIIFTLTAVADAESSADVCNIPVNAAWSNVDGGADTAELNPYELRENVLKVSAVENPFVFPAKCTYTPTQGRIMALASNTVELSQGQFGQHPLLVFCSDGIWAMSVDTSGSVAYLASHPLSHEICVNADSVSVVNDGVVFVGRQGVMLISGGSLKNLSTCMNGGNETVDEVLENSTVRNVISMMDLPAGAASVDFMEYVASATFAFHNSHNELVISNRQYPFSYRFSLFSGTWSTIDVSANGFVNSLSSFAFFCNKDGKCAVMESSNSYSGDNRVLLLTRPMLWGTKMPKRIMQLILHVYSRPVENSGYVLPSVACYMFGSNDGVHFRLLSGRECDKEVQDLRFPYFPTQSHKYYMFAVCGELSAQSRLTGIEMEVEAAWNNRLR